MSRYRRATTWLLGAVTAGLVAVAAVAQSDSGGRASITGTELRDWLSYIASDRLAGVSFVQPTSLLESNWRKD